MGSAVSGRSVMVELRNRRHGNLAPATALVHRRRGMAVTAASVRTTGDSIQMDALVRSIPTGCVAEVAADALLFMNARHDLVVEIEVLPILHARHSQAAKIVDLRKAFFSHPI